MKKSNQKGFSIVEALVIVLVLALLGGASWYVFHKSHKTSTVAANTNNSNTLKLPNKYNNLYSYDSTTILFDGIDPGEGMGELYKSKAVAIETDNVDGTDVYITLGYSNHENISILKTFTGKIDNLKTSITVPESFPTTSTRVADLNIYYTNMSGQTINRTTVVYIAN